MLDVELMLMSELPASEIVLDYIKRVLKKRESRSMLVADRLEPVSTEDERERWVCRFVSRETGISCIEALIEVVRAEFGLSSTSSFNIKCHVCHILRVTR